MSNSPETPPAAPPETPGMGPGPRPRAVLLFMSAPMVFAFFLMGAAVLVAILGRAGTDAKGERLTLRFTGECLAAAAPIVKERVAEIGLGDPAYAEQAGALELTATLPGLPDDRTAMPALLGRPGALAIVSQGQTLAANADLREIELRLDESGMPYTWIRLGPEAIEKLRAAIAADPQGSLRIELDGELAAERPNTALITDDTLRIVTGEGLTADRMRVAADRAILLRHGPLPCALSGAVAG